MTHELEKSDRLTVPKKPPNKAERSAAEKAEGRSLAKGNPPRSDTNRMQSRSKVNSALRRIRHAAERDKRVRFTSLMHHIGPAPLWWTMVGFSRLYPQSSSPSFEGGVRGGRLITARAVDNFGMWLSVDTSVQIPPAPGTRARSADGGCCRSPR